MENCEICGRTKDEVEQLAKRRSDMEGKIEEDENGIKKCDGCSSQNLVGRDKSITKAKDEGETPSMYDQINAGQLGHH